ncbi:MAG: hypothetical protein WB820_02975, partial [Rhodoplanes sp.]
MSDNERGRGQVRVSAADLPSLSGLLTLAVAVAEKRAKFTPSPVQVAPKGKGDPSRRRGLVVSR